MFFLEINEIIGKSIAFVNIKQFFVFLLESFVNGFFYVGRISARFNLYLGFLVVLRNGQNWVDEDFPVSHPLPPYGASPLFPNYRRFFQEK